MCGVGRAGTPLVRESWGESDAYYTLAALQSASGWEGQGVAEDPAFSNAATLDFSLSRSSPAIDKANALYAPSTDALGVLRSAAPDIGAFERQ